jgi:hypothetical protein
MAEITAKKIVQRKVSDLIPNIRNTKIHPDSQIENLANAIKEWGWTIPVLVDEGNNVIAGHGRLLAADSLGMKKVPCIVAVGWTEAQKTAYGIADNKLSEQSRWNEDIYFAEINSLLEDGYNVDLAGVDFELPDYNFTPNIDPTTSSRELNQGDVDKVVGNMAGQIDGLKAGKDDAAVEVICPYCAETFKFTGV